MSSSDRKIGITIISILFLLAAIVFIVVSILCFIPLGTSIAEEVWTSHLVTLPVVGTYLDMLTSFVIPYISIWGMIVLIIGIVVAIDAIGLFLLKKWAHSLAVLISIVAIVIIIGIIFIWYLLKTEVKMSFGKE